MLATIFRHNQRIPKGIITLLLLLTLSLCSFAQGVWNGKSLIYLTDAFDQDVPVGTACIVVEEYGATKLFGREISLGKLKGTKVYELDKYGFYTNDGEKTYVNSYYDDGRIKERDLYKNGKFAGKWVYEYPNDGVAINKYDADGKEAGVVGWSDNQYVSVAPGGGIVSNLNKDMRAISSEIQVTNYRQEVRIKQTNTYNNHGCLESTTISAPGRVQNINYSAYEYDDNGAWIARFSDGKYLKRSFYDQEGYAKKKEQERIEAERKEKERLETETKNIKNKINSRGYANKSEVKERPVFKVTLLDPEKYGFINHDRISLDILMPKESSTFNLDAYPISITVVSPAQIVYPNGTQEDVPYSVPGTLYVQKDDFRTNTSRLEVKIDFNKQKGVWYVKNTKDLISKNRVPTFIIEALNAEIEKRGKAEPFKKKKIYMGKVYQYRAKFVDKDDFNVNVQKEFPIQIELHDSK